MLFTLTGVSGSGKNTIADALFDDDHTVVSYTTRPKRPNEKEGHDYYFVESSTLRFMHMADDIAEYMRFDNHEYAVTKSEINNKLKNGDCLMIANAEGVRKLLQNDFLQGQLRPIILRTGKDKVIKNLKHRRDTEENINKRLALYDEENEAVDKLMKDLMASGMKIAVIDTDKLNQQELIDTIKSVIDR